MKKTFFLSIVIAANGLFLNNVSAQNIATPPIKPASNKKSFQLLSVDSSETKINSLGADAQIVDTRVPEQYAINHLINAININARTNDYETQINKLDKTKPVFAYSLGNGRSLQLAKELIAKGFAQVYVVDSGIGAWIGNGKPVYSSSKDNFSLSDLNRITSTNKLVLLDLHTRYCPTCRKLQPTVDSLASEYSGTLKVVKVDVYDNPKIAGNFKINAVPTLIIYNNGSIIWKRTGGDTYKSDLEAILTNIK